MCVQLDQTCRGEAGTHNWEVGLPYTYTSSLSVLSLGELCSKNLGSCFVRSRKFHN